MTPLGSPPFIPRPKETKDKRERERGETRQEKIKRREERREKMKEKIKRK